MRNNLYAWENIELDYFNIPYFTLIIVCPEGFPRYQQHRLRMAKDHGDVCRKSFKNNNYRCPRGCAKTRNGGPPFCQMSPSNTSPCRLGCEDNFPREQTFPNGSKHGNVCRKMNDNNYRCPRGCRKTKNGKAPFCSTMGSSSRPCRNWLISKVNIL